MARWTCPECEREFDRARQSHVCVPGCTVDETFRGREWQRKLAELRPMVRALSVNLWLPRVVDHERVLRRYDTWHVLRLTDAGQVDDQLRDWLTESYDAAG